MTSLVMLFLSFPQSTSVRRSAIHGDKRDTVVYKSTGSTTLKRCRLVVELPGVDLSTNVVDGADVLEVRLGPRTVRVVAPRVANGVLWIRRIMIRSASKSSAATAVATGIAVGSSSAVAGWLVQCTDTTNLFSLFSTETSVDGGLAWRPAAHCGTLHGEVVGALRYGVAAAVLTPWGWIACVRFRVVGAVDGLDADRDGPAIHKADVINVVWTDGTRIVKGHFDEGVGRKASVGTVDAEPSICLQATAAGAARFVGRVTHTFRSEVACSPCPNTSLPAHRNFDQLGLLISMHGETAVGDGGESGVAQSRHPDGFTALIVDREMVSCVVRYRCWRCRWLLGRQWSP